MNIYTALTSFAHWAWNTQQGRILESIVSLMSLLVVKMLTVLVSTISNSQVFLLKNVSSFCKCKSYTQFFSKNISVYAIFNDQSSNDIVSFEQLAPGLWIFFLDSFYIIAFISAQQSLSLNPYTDSPIQNFVPTKMRWQQRHKTLTLTLLTLTLLILTLLILTLLTLTLTKHQLHIYILINSVMKQVWELKG